MFIFSLDLALSKTFPNRVGDRLNLRKGRGPFSFGMYKFSRSCYMVRAMHPKGCTILFALITYFLAIDLWTVRRGCRHTGHPVEPIAGHWRVGRAGGRRNCSRTSKRWREQRRQRQWRLFSQNTFFHVLITTFFFVHRSGYQAFSVHIFHTTVTVCLHVWAKMWAKIWLAVLKKWQISNRTWTAMSCVYFKCIPYLFLAYFLLSSIFCSWWNVNCSVIGSSTQLYWCHWLDWGEVESVCKISAWGYPGWKCVWTPARGCTRVQPPDPPLQVLLNCPTASSHAKPDP